jgi:hypothetical protein
VIDEGKDPKRPAIEQLIVHEIHAPALRLRCRNGRRPPMQRHVFAPPAPVPQLQAFQAIEPSDALAIHEPAFATEQHVEPQISESRPRMGEFAQAHPKGRLILGHAALVPACS